MHVSSFGKTACAADLQSTTASEIEEDLEHFVGTGNVQEPQPVLLLGFWLFAWP